MIAVGGTGFAQLGAGPLGEAFGGVLADRLQQPVPRRTVKVFGLDQALVHQGGQQVQHLPVRGAAYRGDRFGGLQGPAPSEDRQPVEHHPLLRAEQVVGPVDQGSQGLMARQGGTAPAGQQPEPLIEPGADFRHRQ